MQVLNVNYYVKIYASSGCTAISPTQHEQRHVDLHDGGVSQVNMSVCLDGLVSTVLRGEEVALKSVTLRITKSQICLQFNLMFSFDYDVFAICNFEE